MQFSGLTPEGRDRARRAIRKRWALYTKTKKVDSPHEPTPLRRCLEPRADGRCAEPACPYPSGEGAFCRQHSRDQIAESSPVGTAHALLREFGMVEPSEGAAATISALPLN
jgi:hypothetical protein